MNVTELWLKLGMGDGVPYGIAVDRLRSAKRWVYWTIRLGENSMCSTVKGSGLRIDH